MQINKESGYSPQLKQECRVSSSEQEQPLQGTSLQALNIWGQKDTFCTHSQHQHPENRLKRNDRNGEQERLTRDGNLPSLRIPHTNEASQAIEYSENVLVSRWALLGSGGSLLHSLLNVSGILHKLGLGSPCCSSLAYLVDYGVL